MCKLHRTYQNWHSFLWCCIRIAHFFLSGHVGHPLQTTTSSQSVHVWKNMQRFAYACDMIYSYHRTTGFLHSDQPCHKSLIPWCHHTLKSSQDHSVTQSTRFNKHQPTSFLYKPVDKYIIFAVSHPEVAFNLR